MVKMITLCKINFIFVHINSKKQEKDVGTNSVLSGNKNKNRNNM